MTTPEDARGTVLLAAITATAATAGVAIKNGSVPQLRIAVGGAFVGISLTALSGAAPLLVQRFAQLILVTSLLTSGYVLLGPIVRYLNPSSAAKPLTAKGGQL